MKMDGDVAWNKHWYYCDGVGGWVIKHFEVLITRVGSDKRFYNPPTCFCKCLWLMWTLIAPPQTSEACGYMGGCPNYSCILSQGLLVGCYKQQYCMGSIPLGLYAPGWRMIYVEWHMPAGGNQFSALGMYSTWEKMAIWKHHYY